MATAAEIRKRVRDAERERVKVLEGAAVAVAAAHDRVNEARSALAAAESDFRSAVSAATGKHGLTTKLLANATGVSPAELRNHASKATGAAAPAPADPEE